MRRRKCRKGFRRLGGAAEAAEGSVGLARTRVAALVDWRYCCLRCCSSPLHAHSADLPRRCLPWFTRFAGMTYVFTRNVARCAKTCWLQACSSASSIQALGAPHCRKSSGDATLTCARKASPMARWLSLACSQTSVDPPASIASDGIAEAAGAAALGGIPSLSRCFRNGVPLARNVSNGDYPEKTATIGTCEAFVGNGCTSALRPVRD